MAASVDHTQEDASSAETKENENFVDFSGPNLNHDVLQKSNHSQVTLGSGSKNSLICEPKSIITRGQDPGVDDLLNSENDITNYDWVISPLRNALPLLEMGEHTTRSDHIPISNGHSASLHSKLENLHADCTLTTTVAPKLPTSFSNGVKSSNGTVRRPSPSRKAPPTVKPLRSSTPTSRATATTATKSVVPIKRSITPTPRLSTLPVAKSASRSSTPIKRPSITATAKSAYSRSSTPIQQPSISAAARSALRSSTPTTRSSNPSGSLITSVNGNRSSSAMKSRVSSCSPSVKSRPSKNLPDMTKRSAVKLPVTESNMKAVPRRTSCSRRPISYGVGNDSMNGNGDDVNPVLMGTKMVERVVNMRKLAPPRQGDISNQNNTSGKLFSQENSGFGRSLSKKSFDMAMRHLDIRRSMPGNMRAMIAKVPGSSACSVISEFTKTRSNTISVPLLATGSSENEHSYNQ